MKIPLEVLCYPRALAFSLFSGRTPCKPPWRQQGEKQLMTFEIILKKWKITPQSEQFQCCYHCSVLSERIYPSLNYMLILPCINYLHFTNVFFKMFQTLVLCWFWLQIILELFSELYAAFQKYVQQHQNIRYMFAPANKISGSLPLTTTEDHVKM